jgi:hypothetical protein
MKDGVGSFLLYFFRDFSKNIFTSAGSRVPREIKLAASWIFLTTGLVKLYSHFTPYYVRGKNLLFLLLTVPFTCCSFYLLFLLLAVPFTCCSFYLLFLLLAVPTVKKTFYLFGQHRLF